MKTKHREKERERIAFNLMTTYYYYDYVTFKNDLRQVK